MAGCRARWVVAAVLVAVVGAGSVACGGEGEEEPGARASDLWASATAEAERRFDEIRAGVDVNKDVTLGDPVSGRDGRTTVEVRVRNTADSTKSFAVQVNFTDPDGDFRDAVVLTVADVPAGETGTGTARSTHELSGEVRAEVGRAVRY
ncbi:hypothetical protein SSP24_52850 [Streptomyces spinoverrucosus]|uniref:Lipoprotein n=1 Tax=Streptomyces spinoverrucosus TaxID=284043 RepID=A0A4Y3VPJ2_9ACTN|nr:hypothetical protein [Streptomyces spinoverrucosus]GEC07630.1 hypothetical protein SSP24_52850 [Streptomyces spinoverrucosus]GHB61998.1 hypothetical protein GCM10010397_35090 [Streptomyces spinoverrucosus]